MFLSYIFMFVHIHSLQYLVDEYKVSVPLSTILTNMKILIFTYFPAVCFCSRVVVPSITVDFL